MNGKTEPPLTLPFCLEVAFSHHHHHHHLGLLWCCAKHAGRMHYTCLYIDTCICRLFFSLMGRQGKVGQKQCVFTTSGRYVSAAQMLQRFHYANEQQSLTTHYTVGNRRLPSVLCALSSYVTGSGNLREVGIWGTFMNYASCLLGEGQEFK